MRHLLSIAHQEKSKHGLQATRDQIIEGHQEGMLNSK